LPVKIIGRITRTYNDTQTIYDIFLYIIYFIYTFAKKIEMNTMNTEIKRKNIDLPVNTWQKLSFMAISQGKSLKAYIEQILISKADSIKIEVNENPSPSGDKWFDDIENIKSIAKGMNELKENKGKEYTIDEIKTSLGL